MKLKHFFSILIAIVWIFDVSGFNADHVYSENSLKISYSFDSPSLSKPLDGLSDSQSVHLEGFQTIITPGMPALVHRQEKFLIPQGTKISNLNVESIIDSIQCNIAFNGPRQASNGEYLNNIINIESPLNSPNEFTMISEIQKYRDNSIGVIEITPMQYNAKDQILYYAKSLTITIEFSQLKSNRICEAELHSSGILDQILTIPSESTSSDITPLAIIPFDPGKTAPGCILITPEEFLSEANRFAAWKRKLGYNVYVRSLSSSILQDPQQVKDVIQNVYDETPTLEYIVLFGGGEIIKPFKGDWYNYDMSSKGVAQYYTDYYFACMDDEDFEDDDTRDYTADLIIGRFPANNIDDLKIMIDKCIDYENNPPIDDALYFNNCTLFAEFDPAPLSYNGRNHIYKDKSNFIYSTEQIIDNINNNSWNYGANLNRVYYSPKPAQTASWFYLDGKTIPSYLYPTYFNWYISKDKVIESIDNGSYLLSFRGHGNVDLWSHLYFGNDDVRKLTNNHKYPIGFAITCLSGAFYNPANKDTGKKSLCESFLSQSNGGCASMIGANSESWPYYNEYLYAGLFEAMYPGSMIDFKVPYQPNNTTAFQYNTFKPIMYQAESEIGKILSMAGERMFEVCGYDIYSRMNRETFHCLGDPMLKIYRYKPTIKTPIINQNGGIITITDSDRILVASAKNGGSVFLPNKVGDSWEVQNYIKNYDLSLISDNRLYGQIYAPYFIDDSMLMSYNISSSKIDNITKQGNIFKIEYTSDSTDVNFCLYDVYGQETNRSYGINGLSSIDSNNGINILVMEVNGEVVDRKIIH